MRLLIAVLLIIVLTPFAQADRSLEGSQVYLDGPWIYQEGDTYIVQMTVSNGSTDMEWIAEFHIFYPPCLDVLAGWYEDMGEPEGPQFRFEIYDHACAFIDDNGGWGEIYDGESLIFWMEVFVNMACDEGEEIIHWLLQGDIYGDEPHVVEGDFIIEILESVATESTTWTQLRSLY